jgi:carbamoyltransferase
MAKHIKKETNENNLCIAGGVALNCVANGKILRENIFDDIWIQPAAGDAGGAIGAALYTWYKYLDKPRNIISGQDSQKGSYLGPAFSDEEIKAFLDEQSISYSMLDRDEIASTTAKLLAEENVIGWFQGRMEFGPRALGARSIIGDARSPKMQEKMNLKIKFRESFRPFAPSVLEDKVSDYFEIDRPSPYMLLVAEVKKERQKEMSEEEKNYFGIQQLNVVRSDIPAVTHVDYSARIQTVSRGTNPLYYDMIKKFDEENNCAVIVNTSFNVRGEPIVCTPEDAYRCFMRTDMDYLVMGGFLLDKSAQPKWEETKDWKKEFALD